MATDLPIARAISANLLQSVEGEPLFDRIGLISMGSIMRSNIEVGLPIDLAIACHDSFAFRVLHRIEPGSHTFMT